MYELPAACTWPIARRAGTLHEGQSYAFKVRVLRGDADNAGGWLDPAVLQVAIIHAPQYRSIIPRSYYTNTNPRGISDLCFRGTFYRIEEMALHTSSEGV